VISKKGHWELLEINAVAGALFKSQFLKLTNMAKNRIKALRLLPAA